MFCRVPCAGHSESEEGLRLGQEEDSANSSFDSRKAGAAGRPRGSLCLEGFVAGRIICDDKTRPSSLHTKTSREGLRPSLLLEREGESSLGSHGVQDKGGGQTELFSD